jgi:hypothetical protein
MMAGGGKQSRPLQCIALQYREFAAAAERVSFPFKRPQILRITFKNSMPDLPTESSGIA